MSEPAPALAPPPPSKAPSYLDRARDGQGTALAYSLGFLLILGAWLLVGGLVTVLAGALLAPGTPTDELDNLTGATGLAVALLGFVPFLLATPLAVRWILRRPWLTVVTAARRVAWRRVLQGAAWWTLLAAGGTAVDYAVHRDSYALTFDAGRFVPALAVAVVLLPLQTTAEELLFRGYLVQWMSLRTRSIVVLSVADGVLFALPHLANPEAAGAQWYAWLVWWLYGVGWCWVSVRDGSIELAIGAHAANNLFGVLVVGYAASALPVASVWTTTTLDLPLSIAVIAVMQVLFVAVTRPRAGRPV